MLKLFHLDRLINGLDTQPDQPVGKECPISRLMGKVMFENSTVCSPFILHRSEFINNNEIGNEDHFATRIPGDQLPRLFMF